jgi:hypothetical protein
MAPIEEPKTRFAQENGYAECRQITFPALKSERVSSLAGKKVFEFVFSKAAG